MLALNSQYYSLHLIPLLTLVYTGKHLFKFMYKLICSGYYWIKKLFSVYIYNCNKCAHKSCAEENNSLHHILIHQKLVHTLVKISIIVTISVLPPDSIQFNIPFTIAKMCHLKSSVTGTDQNVTVQLYVENTTQHHQQKPRTQAPACNTIECQHTGKSMASAVIMFVFQHTN